MTAPDKTPDSPEHLWEQGWDGHELAQRRRMAKLTLGQKLDWLEEAQRIVEHVAKSRGAKTTDGLEPEADG